MRIISISISTFEYPSFKFLLCTALSFLEQLHQLVQNFFHFAPLKPTFSILHTHFYKIPTSVCLFYTFIQIKYSFLFLHSHRHRPTPVSHRNPHNPPATNPANQKNKPSNPESTQPNNTIHTTHPKSTPCLEQQDRRLRWRWRERETRSTPPKASGGDGDGERHSTRNPLIKSPFNPKTTRNKGIKSDRRRQWRSAAAMAIDGS